MSARRNVTLSALLSVSVRSPTVDRRGIVYSLHERATSVADIDFGGEAVVQKGDRIAVFSQPGVRAFQNIRFQYRQQRFHQLVGIFEVVVKGGSAD